MRKRLYSPEEAKKQNRRRARERYHRLKDDPVFKEKERIRNAKRRPPLNTQHGHMKGIPYKKNMTRYRDMVVGLLVQRDGWMSRLDLGTGGGETREHPP